MKNQYTYNIFRKIMMVIIFNLFIFQTYAQDKSCSADFEFMVNPISYEVSFTNTSSGSPTTVLWHFGDYDTSTDFNPVHQYQDTGTYLVCLEIYSDLCQDMTCKTIAIAINGVQDCEAIFDYSSTEQDLEIHFENLTGGSVDSVLWDFGDGYSSDEFSPNHQYEEADSFLACLYIFSGDCLDIVCYTVNPSFRDCEVAFSFERLDSLINVQFINESIGMFDEWLWDFGDGNTSILEQPSHEYSSSGHYKVLLQGKRNNGVFCQDTVSHSIDIIKPDTCFADFGFIIDPSRPNIIQFNDSSSDNITNWEWNFNDNPNGSSVSSQENPQHVFPENGDYNVSLTVNNNNCMSVITKTVSVDVILNIDFTFVLDSLSPVQNTFLFHSQIEGIYDHLIWDFDNDDVVIVNNLDTTHSYEEQDKDYQVCLTAEYRFNDTSLFESTLCKGLTTSEYFNIGGQIVFGDSLLNNPYSTGDSALAYLYRVDGGNMVAVDTNYFDYLGYYWFPQKIKAYYIIKTALTQYSAHFSDFAPTYVGNTTQWDEAEIINLAQDKYREDIHLVEEFSINKGLTNLEGSVYDILNINEQKELNAVVCLFDMDDGLINYQYADDNGDYLFENISEGHYMLSVDVTGVPVRPQLIYVNGKQNRDFKASSLNIITELFPNPARDYSILYFENNNETAEIILQVTSATGELLSEKKFAVIDGENFFSLDLTDYNKGLLFVRINDGREAKAIKLLHY